MVVAADREQDVRPMRLADACAAIRSQLSPVLGCETVSLAEARRRILATDLVAAVDLPPRSCSAVDGFAVRAADLAATGLTKLRLVGEAAAGHPYIGPVGPGQAIRILTGAPMPSGADAIVMQESCLVEGHELVIRDDTRGRRHLRERGEDVRAGLRVLQAGRRLRTQDVALAAALGCRNLSVRKPLQVSLFSTGDELREPGDPLDAGQIWDVNRCLLRGLLENLGCEVHDLGILPDNARFLEGALSAAARNSDLLITSGGMSVGREDHIRSIIARRGTLDVWPLAIKPGKPVGLGDIDACPILALPGNPVAAVVTFIAFGRSVVNIVSGALDEPPDTLTLPAGFGVVKKKGVRQFLLANISKGRDGASIAAPLAKQGSAMLSALSASSGFIVLTEDCDRVRRDDLVDFVPLSAHMGS